MNKLGKIRLGLTYAGCFLGAGYVSGQELWQFFGSFGVGGFFGLLLAVALLLAFGVMVFYLAKKKEIYEMDKIIVKSDIPAVRALVGFFAVFFMYGVYIIMSAGAAALLERLLGLPAIFGSLVFCVAVAYFSYKGIDSMVRAFSWFVPVLVVGTVLISAVVVFGSNSGFNLNSGENNNILLGNWLFSALTYVSYNLFGTIGIISPLARDVDIKTSRKGVAFGCVLLLLIALGILASIAVSPDVADAELPMLELAYSVSMFVGVLYAVLMLFAMFGTSLSSFVAVLEYGCQKSKRFSNKKLLFVAVLGTLAWLFSLFGFGELISVIYPMCGYLGFVAIAGLIIHIISYCRLNKKEKTN